LTPPGQRRLRAPVCTPYRVGGGQPLLQRDVHERRGGGETATNFSPEHQRSNTQELARIRLLWRNLYQSGKNSLPTGLIQHSF